MKKEANSDQVNDLIDQRLNQGDSRAALDTCINDKSAVQQWRNFHLIGDVIRGDVSETGNCLISKISTVLDREPTILAPVRNPEPVKTAVGAAVGGEKDKPNDTLKAAGMFAIAASVALFAVLGVSTAPIDTTESAVAAVAIPSGPDDAQTFEAEFGQMLVEHGEFTATSGLNGLVAYAKLVSNESLGQ